MKKIFYLAVPLCVYLAGCSPIIYTGGQQQPTYNNQPQDVYAGQAVTDQVFYDELSPYGQWIDYPDYGYVWQPNVDPDFRPYDTNGNWVYSDYGWTWVSDYSWGWAPFHYGRWFYDAGYGWLWTPGEQWAPAWVTWGQSDDYYGWAPVPPGVDFNSGWRPRNEDWNFVEARQINRLNVNSYVVRNNVTAINRATIINNINSNNTSYNNTPNNRGNNIIYNRGPRVNEVENAAGTKIPQVRINGSARPGQSLANNQLNVYRPAIISRPDNNRPAPQKFTSYRAGNNPGFGQARNTQGGRPGNGQATSPDLNHQQPSENRGRGNGRLNGPDNNHQQNQPNQVQGSQQVVPNANQPQVPQNQGRRNEQPKPNGNQGSQPVNVPANNPNPAQSRPPLRLTPRPGTGSGLNPNPNPVLPQGQQPARPTKIPANNPSPNQQPARKIELMNQRQPQQQPVKQNTQPAPQNKRPPVKVIPPPPKPVN